MPAQEKAIRTPTPHDRIPAGRLWPPSTPAVADVDGHRADVTHLRWQAPARPQRAKAYAAAGRSKRPPGRATFVRGVPIAAQPTRREPLSVPVGETRTT